MLDEWYDRLAEEVGRPHRGPMVAVAAPSVDGHSPDGSARSRQTIWLCENLDHLTEHLGELVQPAAHVAEIRRRPWWQ